MFIKINKLQLGDMRTLLDLPDRTFIPIRTYYSVVWGMSFLPRS